MSVLAMPFSLGDGPGRIEDVEALVRKVLKDRVRHFGGRGLKPHDEEDAITYLIGVSWELSRRYDPAKDRKPNLAAYVAHILSLRVADWYRQRFGDTRHGEKPIVLSLDAPVTLNVHADSGGFHGPSTAGSDRLVDTLAASTGDPALDRAPDLVGVLQRGGGGGAEPHDPLGEPPAGGATSRNRSAAGLKKGHIVGTKRRPSRPPVCGACYATFFSAFTKVNAKMPAEQQLGEEQLELKAARRAQAVRFGAEWACPRCTKLEDAHGKDLMLNQAYPNRLTRRQAAKAAGLNKPRRAKAAAGRSAA